MAKNTVLDGPSNEAAELEAARCLGAPSSTSTTKPETPTTEETIAKHRSAPTTENLSEPDPTATSTAPSTDSDQVPVVQ